MLKMIIYAIALLVRPIPPGGMMFLSSFLLFGTETTRHEHLMMPVEDFSPDLCQSTATYQIATEFASKRRIVLLNCVI
jgi:hypothetical protein